MESPFEIPEDFESFWRSATEEAEALPLDFERSHLGDHNLPGFIVETVDFSSMGGRRLHGWIAYQAGALEFPAFLWPPPYGRESMLPNEYGTRDGFVSFSFNFHGEDAFYQEKYVPERGYFAKGAESPESWIFRQMFQDAVVAVRVLQAQPEADGGRIGAMGMSQGGGISIWLGAWCKAISAVCADMPFLGNIGTTLQGNLYRFPLKELSDFMTQLPLGHERVQHTVSYYDTVFHASRCQKPTQISLGLKDPAARPEQVKAIFEALLGTKALRVYDVGHDWCREMVDNNRNWLLENLR